MDDITARDFDGLIDAVDPDTGESDPLGYWLTRWPSCRRS